VNEPAPTGGGFDSASAKEQGLSAAEEVQPGESLPASVWICLRAKPKKENMVARALREDSLVEVFCPLIRFRRPTARGAVWFQEALFPGYLFVRLEPSRDLRRVASTQGSIGPVRFAGEISFVPCEVIASLQEPYAMAPEQPLVLAEPIETGQEKQIVEGPFRGLTCTVRHYMPARRRVEILVEFLGQVVAAQVEPGILYTRREAAEARSSAFSLRSDD
jgi:transcriptional antiterminator RfaH